MLIVFLIWLFFNARRLWRERREMALETQEIRAVESESGLSKEQKKEGETNDNRPDIGRIIRSSKVVRYYRLYRRYLLVD